MQKRKIQTESVSHKQIQTETEIQNICKQKHVQEHKRERNKNNHKQDHVQET
jgi:hypothetical protein